MNDENRQARTARQADAPPRHDADAPEKAKSAKPAEQKPTAKKGSAKKASDDFVSSSTVQSGFQTRSRNQDASKQSGKTKKEQPDMGMPRSAKPAHKVIPYLLIGVALFLAVTLILNIFCNTNDACAENPSAHWMGPVGYWICYGLFGVFGPAMFALPFFILNMAFFWKRYIDHKLVIEKTVISLLLLIFLATTIHAFGLIPYPAEARALTASELLAEGVCMRGGGVIGGGLAYFLVTYLNIAGGVIISLFLTILAAFFFIGMTPQHIMDRLRAQKSLRASQRKPLGADEEAPIRENMKRKHDRAARGEELETRSTGTPPEGAVQYDGQSAKGGKHKKEIDDEELNPRVMPILDASDDTPPNRPLYVPNELVQKEAEEKAAAKAKELEKQKAELAAAAAAQQRANEEAERRSAAEAKRRADEEANRRAEELQRRAAAEQAARQRGTNVPSRPVPPSERAQERDAMDPVFPRAVNKNRMAKKVQKSDRDFELGSIFINLDDHSDPKPRKHEPLPPEVPLPGAQKPAAPARATQATTEAKPAAQAAHARSTATAAPAAPAQKAGITPTPAKPANRTPANAAAPAAGKQPEAQAKQAQKQAPIFRQAAPSEQTEYGLSREEFERREAAGQAISRATTASKPAAKAANGKAAPAGAEKAVAKKPAAVHEVKPYVFPPISYLHPGEPITVENMEEIRNNMNKLSQTLANFNVRIREITYSCGPTVTRYEIFPDAGVRVRTITNLSEDIALAFSVQGVRMEAIDGKSAIGVEVPNTTRSNIYLRDLLETKKFSESKSRLTAGLGADVTGNPLLFDIVKMPHLLVAGTTGSGKSICINCIIMSILFKARPDEVKIILIDPKKVEFSLYKGLPHLMAPIVVTPKDAAGALQAAVEEMENRFAKIQDVGVRDITGYNEAAAKDPDLEPMPHVVIIIDELADLMMTARDEVEDSICRLAQKARAAGMHIIVGTQRPSVDVVTGLIKSNIPSRIACTVRSQVDSRTILDFAGAEKLLGRGDMLFAPIGAMKPTRVQGAFVSDDEVEKICEFIRATNGTAQYDESFTKRMKEYSSQCGNKKGGKTESDLALPTGEGGDNKYVDAIRIAIEENRVSTSLLQRKLGIGYSRAAKIIDRMEEEGLVSKQDGSKPRSILISAEQFIERYVAGDEGAAAEEL